MGDLVAGKLGTAQEIRDANHFYNAYTRQERRLMQEIFQKLCGHFTRTLSPAGNYAIRELLLTN